ncbi:MAG: XrtA/PEP-CTERM system TPR-repeat protein PrsT [Pseudomonadota bacterium]
MLIFEPTFMPLLRRVCLMLAALALSACGLTTSDEERMESASQSITAGEYRAAMIELKKVLNNDESNADARFKLAKVSLGLGDFVAAEVNLQRAVESGLTGPDVRRLSLDILLAQSKFSDMLTALETPPAVLANAERLKYIGRAQLGLGKTEIASGTYQQLAQLQPDSVDAALGLASIDAASGRADAAVIALQALVDRAPDQVDAQLLLGTLHQRRADYASAERAFEAAIAAVPRETSLPRYLDILSNLVDSQLSLGALDAASGNLKTLRSLAPNAPPALFLSAKLARASGDPEGATRDLQQLLQITPDDLQAQYMLGQLQLQRGNLEQAEEVLSRLVSLAPSNVAARKLLAQVQLQRARPDAALAALAPVGGDVDEDLAMQKLFALARLQQGDIEAAIDNLEQARALDPSDRKTQLGLASLQVSNGDFASAEALLREMTQVSDDFRRESLLLAAMDGQGKSAEAATFARQLAQSNADSADALRIASIFLLNSGDAAEAERLVSRRIDAAGKDPAVYVVYGDVLIAQQKIDAASQAYEQAAALSSNDLDALLGMTRVALLQNRGQDARDLLIRTIDAHPAAVLPRQILIDLALRSGDFELANSSVSSLAALERLAPDARQFVSRVMLQLGRFDEGLAQAERAVQENPRDRNALFQKARVLVAMRRSNAARATLQNALQISPDWLQARATLAIVEMEEGMFASAEENIQQLERAHPEETAGVMLRGEWLARQERFEDAARTFARATQEGADATSALREFQVRQAGQLANPKAPLEAWLARNPGDVGIRMALAQHLQAQGDTAGASAAYDRVLDADDSNVVALNNLAWQYQQQGDLVRATQLAERAHKLSPDSAAIADTLGWIYRSAGRADDAVRLLKQANELAADDPEIQYHLAAALLDSGDAPAAKRALTRLVESDSNFPSREEAATLLREL